MTTPSESRPSTAAETALKMRLDAHPQDTVAPDAVPSSAAPCELPLWVLIVHTPSDRVTRRVFLSLHAAVRATERATTRGHSTLLELCHVLPGAVSAHE